MRDFKQQNFLLKPSFRFPLCCQLPVNKILSFSYDFKEAKNAYWPENQIANRIFSPGLDELRKNTKNFLNLYRIGN